MEHYRNNEIHQSGSVDLTDRLALLTMESVGRAEVLTNVATEIQETATAAVPSAVPSSSSSAAAVETLEAVEVAGAAASGEPLAPLSAPQSTAAADRLSHFCEKNRSLLNALVRQNIRLLEGSLMPLLSSQGGRKILDFDVKRAYLKLKLRRLRRSAEKEEDEDDKNTVGFSEESESDDMPIAVEIERERIIESSYNALQHVSPRRLLRGNFDIIFENEEGVDGGGLTREWYALLMREVSALGAASVHSHVTLLRCL